MLRKLERWLWAGSLEHDFKAFDLGEELFTNAGDVRETLSRYLREASARVEAEHAALERKLASLQAGTTPEATSSDHEIKQVARSLLPSLDALDRIIEFGDSCSSMDEVFQNWLTSVKSLRIRLNKTLEGIGLVALSAVGTEVDFELHDVVSIIPAGSHPPNTIVAEQQRGYYFRGKLLRDAKVVVAQ